MRPTVTLLTTDVGEETVLLRRLLTQPGGTVHARGSSGGRRLGFRGGALSA